MGSWNILNLKFNVNDKWSVFGEAQLRSLKFYNNFYYYEYKGGVNYKVHKNATLSLGAGSYQTYKEGGNFVLPENNDEFRVWPQIIVFQSLGKLKLEQRYVSLPPTPSCPSPVSARSLCKNIQNEEKAHRNG